jgi:hypothetical protein
MQVSKSVKIKKGLLLRLEFVFSSWTIHPGPKRSGGQIQVPKTLKKKKWLILRPEFVFSSCAIDPGQKRNGGQIQAPKSVQRNKGLLLRPGFCPQFLHNRSKSQKNWTNTFKS